MAKDIFRIDAHEAYPEHLRQLQVSTGEALERSDFDGLVIHSGNPMHQAGRDIEMYPLPHPDFSRWISGLHQIDAPSAQNGTARLDATYGHAVIYDKNKDRPTLVVRSDRDNRWELQAQVPDGAEEHFDIVTKPTDEEVWAEVRKSIPHRTAFIGSENMPGVDHTRRKFVPHLIHAPENLLSNLAWNRATKTDYELACLVEATRRGAIGHRAIREMFESQSDVSEGNILHAFLDAVEHGELDSPYPPIVAMDSHSAILHYFRPNHGVKNGKTLLVDAGAQVNGNPSDITTTNVREGVHGKFRECLSGLDLIQRRLSGMIMPGANFGDIQKEMYIQIATLLKELGIISGVDAEEAANNGIVRPFIIHSVGHSLGNRVHDETEFQLDKAGRSPAKYSDPAIVGVAARAKIRPRQVMTVEPGIYFNPQTIKETLERKDEKDRGKRLSTVNMTLVEKLAPNGGMRLESNVVPTRKGAIDVTRRFLPDLTNA